MDEFWFTAAFFWVTISVVIFCVSVSSFRRASRYAEHYAHREGRKDRDYEHWASRKREASMGILFAWAWPLLIPVVAGLLLWMLAKGAWDVLRTVGEAVGALARRDA